MTPIDVLQVINYINRGGQEQEPTGDVAEGEPNAGHAPLVHDAGLATIGAAGSFMPATLLRPSAVSDPQTGMRVESLADAVDELAVWTAARQSVMPLERGTWQRWDAALRETNDGELPDWGSFLDDPTSDLADLDAYFAALV